MNNKLYSYSIMPLIPEHLEEICQDIKLQYESGVSNCALFSMTLVPEGNPPSDKVHFCVENSQNSKKGLVKWV